MPTQVFVKYFMKDCVPHKLESEIEKSEKKIAFAWMWIYVYGSNQWKYSRVSHIPGQRSCLIYSWMKLFNEEFEIQSQIG